MFKVYSVVPRVMSIHLSSAQSSWWTCPLPRQLCDPLFYPLHTLSAHPRLAFCHSGMDINRITNQEAFLISFFHSTYDFNSFKCFSFRKQFLETILDLENKVSIWLLRSFFVSASQSAGLTLVATGQEFLPSVVCTHRTSFLLSVPLYEWPSGQPGHFPRASLQSSYGPCSCALGEKSPTKAPDSPSGKPSIRASLGTK